jgi:hypothetical protein
MKVIILPLLLVFASVIKAQEIAGKWYSKDSTRIYLIYKNENQFEAILEKSTRKDDKQGTFVLRQVTSRNKKKWFRGLIYPADSAMPALAKIRFEDKEGKVLRFCLRRMFFMNITIRWYRVEENKTSSL